MERVPLSAVQQVIHGAFERETDDEYPAIQCLAQEMVGRMATCVLEESAFVSLLSNPRSVKTFGDAQEVVADVRREYLQYMDFDDILRAATARIESLVAHEGYEEGRALQKSRSLLTWILRQGHKRLRETCTHALMKQLFLVIRSDLYTALQDLT